jgi:hypothetical protein
VSTPEKQTIKNTKPYVVLKKNNHARDIQYYVSIILKTIKNYYFTCVIVNKVCKVLHAHKVLFHFVHFVVLLLLLWSSYTVYTTRLSCKEGDQGSRHVGKALEVYRLL